MTAVQTLQNHLSSDAQFLLQGLGEICVPQTPENFCRLFNHPSIAAKCTFSQNVLVLFYTKTPGILREKKVKFNVDTGNNEVCGCPEM